MIDRIRRSNPTIHIYEVTDARFSNYGRLLSGIDTSGMLSILENQTGMPELNNTYTSSFKPLEEEPAVEILKGNVFGRMEVQAGFCNGYGFKLNALEYHKSPEVNLTSTGAVLFLARADDLCQNHIHSSEIDAFYLPAGVLIELHPRTLHFAPCRISESGFRCVVILEKGTNEPITKPGVQCSEEDQLLKMKNKWMIAHPDFIKASGNQAFNGIDGKNLEIRVCCDE